MPSSLLSMSKKDYKWKRFWCPRSGRINLTDGGYLYDPDAEWGKACNPDLVSLEAIADVPCLVLLGEPGIGKSRAIKKAVETETYEQDPLVLDLHSYGSEDRLVKNLFQSSQFKAWVEGNYTLHIFLDSLDECLVRIDNVTALLAEEFERHQDKVDRLFLRIACRTAVWQSSFEEQLKQSWGKDKVKVYELAPLRWRDVRQAAECEGIEDPDLFMQEIWDKRIVPFAIKPITLGFLLTIYRRNGQFPEHKTLSGLYLEGCRILCDEEEDKPELLLPGHQGNLELDQRLIIAARIAAITVFANRDAIWTGRVRGQVPEDDVLSRELAQGYERANARSLEASEASITEALNTGLFSSRDTNRMGWAHQTYAEFLAAWYLTQHNLNLSQILSLIVHPDGRIVPQLQETIAWLTNMRSDVFQEVMKTDPNILLQGDLTTVTEADKEVLVEALLESHNEEKLPYEARAWLYKNLSHSKLVDQLRQYLCDETKSVNARDVAIDIAEVCNVRDLQEELVDLALDSQQPSQIRIKAAGTVNCIGDEATKAKLKPLALAAPKDGVEEDLKGYGLRAVWPNHITAEELFRSLTLPKRKVIGGRYQDFIAKDIGQALFPTDLPIALEWLENQPTRHDLHYPFGQLSDAIMLEAWKYIDNPKILDAFTKVASFRLKQFDEIVDDRRTSSSNQLPFDDDRKRHLLLETLVARLSDSENNPLWLTEIIIPNKDFLWLIECLNKSESERIQWIWSRLIWRSFNRHQYQLEQVEAVLVACENNSTLKAQFIADIEPIELASLEAQKAKAEYLEKQKWNDKNRYNLPLIPPPKERVLQALEQFESGDCVWWLSLCFEMTLEPNSTHYGEPFESSLTSFPGWIEAEDSIKERIIRAARLYLEQGNPENQAWIGTNTFDRSAMVGYQALRLLLEKAPNSISTISTHEWAKWTPIILAYPSVRDLELHRDLLKRAYQNTPTEFIKTLQILIDGENEQYGSVHIHQMIRSFWDECLARVLLEKVKDEKLKAKSIGNLLEDLLIHKVDGAKIFAESLISLPIPNTGEVRAKAAVAACSLILYTEDASWSVVWSAIQQDPEFGREVLEGVSNVIKFGKRPGQNLREEYLADLYIFLAKQYPDLDEERPVSLNDSIRIWRNYIPQRLQERGTQEACDALRKIIHELPELKDKLQWRLLETEVLVRRKAWQPPTPEEFLQFVLNQDKRLVQSGQHLLEVLIESLKRLELELQGETPAARDLWDKVGSSSFKPLDENAFSDYVKRFLDRDLKSRGIIANREVELRRSYGGNPGERTDIHVDAVLKHLNGEVYDSITVIIEVKGCWHSKVQTAMRTQLVERYLANNACPYGLYVVGWFNCQQWDNNDSRRNQALKIRLDEARTQFNDQAKELSSSGNVIRAYVLNTALR